MKILAKFGLVQGLIRLFGLAPLASVWILALALAACVETGDFGRRKPSIFAGKSQSDLAPDALLSAYSLTDDESELRTRAFLYQSPPRQPLWPAIAAIDDLVGSSFDVYYARLAGERDASPFARYRRLASDIAADHAGIAPFRAIACRVQRADAKRMDVIHAGEVQAVAIGGQDQSDLLRRMGENAALISDVETRFVTRHDIFKKSLARLRLSSPDPESAGIEPLLRALDSEISKRRSCTPSHL